MTYQTIPFRDPVVQDVVNKFVDRSDVGLEKYGKTLREDNSDVLAWLNHIQEELMDATLYIQRLKEEIHNLREEKALLREINDIDVIDAFEVKVKKNKTGHLIGRGDHYYFTIESPVFSRAISDTTNSHFAFGHPHEKD